MGAKHSFRSPNGGGIPFLYAPHISSRLPLSSLPFLLSSWQIFRQNGQKWAKVNFFLLAFVFSRENRRQQGAKT